MSRVAFRYKVSPLISAPSVQHKMDKRKTKNKMNNKSLFYAVDEH